MRNIVVTAAALLLAASLPASCATLPKGAEASLRVTGTIEVGADGTMLHHTIDQPEKLTTDKLGMDVLGLIDRSMADWHFKPMVATERATMSLLIRVKGNDSGKYDLWIESADFESPAAKGSDWTFGQKAPPEYPSAAMQAGVGGTVYLYVHLDRDGKVIDAIASQVDLNVRDRPAAMEHWRSILGYVSVATAKSWRFQPPVNPADGSNASPTVMVPVSFSLSHALPAYGQWQGYYPGPHHTAPWLTGPESASMKNPAALAADGIFPVKHGGLELVTRLEAN